MIHIVCSVPQGSVFGPRLFTSYKADLAEVVKNHNMNIHVFADDTRSCISIVIATRWQQLLDNWNDVC